MTFTLGINTCFAVKRWPRPADWAPVVRALGVDVVQHSFDLVDLECDAAWVDEQAGALRQACDAFALDLHSTFTGLAAYSSNLLLHPERRSRDRAEAWYLRAIDFTAAVDARSTGGHVGAYSVPDWRDQERRLELDRELRERLERLARAAKARGLQSLYVENLAARREPSTMREVESLLRSGDDAHVPIELALDVGHQCVAGTSGPQTDPYAWLERLGARAGVIHLQQSDAVADHHWPFTAKTNAIGRIDAGRVLRSLHRGGATGATLILEVIPPFEADDTQVLHELEESVAYWQAALGELAALGR